MKILVLVTLIAVSQASTIVEEIILKEGNQRQREERRFDNQRPLQEVELVYEEAPNEIIEDIITVVRDETTETMHTGLGGTI